MKKRTKKSMTYTRPALDHKELVSKTQAQKNRPAGRTLRGEDLLSPFNLERYNSAAELLLVGCRVTTLRGVGATYAHGL